MDAARWAALAAWLTLAVYVVIGFYAKRQLDEYRQERREALRPYVVVDFSVDFIVDLVVANIGTRPAREVRFSFSEPLTSTIGDSSAVRASALREGLPMLPPGKRYAFLLDSAPARFKAGNLCMSYEVAVTYADDHGRSYVDTYILDLASISDASIERTPLHEVVKAVDDLRKEVHKWTDRSSGLLVHARDKDAMLEAESQWLAERRHERQQVAAEAPPEASDTLNPDRPPLRSGS
ncbi:MAG: hypothetical protein WCF04_11340 [Candidatus Nanopelagicales bacterium]